MPSGFDGRTSTNVAYSPWERQRKNDRHTPMHGCHNLRRAALFTLACLFLFRHLQLVVIQVLKRDE